MDEDADPRAVGARVRGQNWGDAQARGLMRQIAADLAERAGFETCAIEVVRPEGQLEFVAITGSPEGEDLVGAGSLLSHMEQAISEGTTHGLFTFIRAEQMSPETVSGLLEQAVIPAIPVPDDPEAWHPLDMLVAQVRDDGGDLRGLVYLDLPHRLRRPSPARVAAISDAVALSLRSVLTVIEREAFAHHIRMVQATRRLLRTAHQRHDVAALVREATGTLRGAFHAAAFEMHLLDEEEGTWADALCLGVGPAGLDALEAAAARAWERQGVVIVEQGRVWGDDLLAAELGRTLTRGLAGAGFGTVVLAPVGAEQQVLGMMLIARAEGGRRWTDAEGAAALDLGHDLGRTILDARSRAREHDLVELLRSREEQRRAFFSSIIHELKSPLTIIRANAELLETTDGLPAGAVRKVQAIERGVARLLDTVSDLTLLQQVTDPAREPARVTVDLAAVLEDVLLTMEAVASRTGVTVELEETSPGWWVLGDPGELSGALTNLVDNAVKYSWAGGRVHVSLSREDGWIAFSCRDEGMGISKEDQAALFTPFFRSTNPDALARPGSGLGLDIVRRVVQRHGGQISVVSALGQGSTVRLLLPALVGEPE